MNIRNILVRELQEIADRLDDPQLKDCVMKVDLAWEDEDKWHTGSPTEDDIKSIDKDNEYCFALCFYYDGWWLSDFLFKANIEEGCFETAPGISDKKVHKLKFGEDIFWRKIGPYLG